MWEGTCAVLMKEERARLVHYTKRLRSDGLVVGTSGNISVRSGDHIAITPSGLDYDELTPELVCVVSTSGEAVEATLAPSTELPMHLAAYRLTDAAAVVHSHSPYATTLSTLIDELPPIHYMIADLGGRVRVTPYHSPGSDVLAAAMGEALRDRTGVILGNHGSLTVGATLERAYGRNVTLEWLAALYYRSRLLGEPRLVEDDEVAHIAEMLSGYFVSASGHPEG